MRVDLHNNISAKVAMNSAAITSNTTTHGNIIDMLGFDALEFLILAAAITDGTYTAVIEEGNDSGLSDAAVVNANNIFGTLPSFISTSDNTVQRIGYRPGAFRYVRLSLTSTGVTSGGTMSAVAVLGNADNMPVA